MDIHFLFFNQKAMNPGGLTAKQTGVFSHDSAPFVQWQSGRCSLTAQAVLRPGTRKDPFGGDPFPLPGCPAGCGGY